MKSIKLMPDYHCFPLWHHSSDRVGNIDPQTLAISPWLISQIDTWRLNYDATLNTENPIASGFASKADEIAFVVAGYELAKALKAELADTHVVYYDIDQKRNRPIPNV